jgi:hypothetical protein
MLKLSALWFVVNLSICVNPAQAEPGSAPAFGWSGKRAEVKAQSRWSLDQWLAQRDRMKWSDLWLSMNTPSPYEFFVNGAYSLVPDSTGKPRSLRYGAGAYARIFGLEYEHLTVYESEDHYRFHLRVFGRGIQNTHLTFQGGIRHRAGTEIFNQWYLGSTANLYLERHFGIHFLYRYHLKSIDTALLGTPFGHRLECGPYLDFGDLRMSATFLAEVENTSAIGTRGAYGWSAGATLYF